MKDILICSIPFVFVALCIYAVVLRRKRVKALYRYSVITESSPSTTQAQPLDDRNALIKSSQQPGTADKRVMRIKYDPVEDSIEYRSINAEELERKIQRLIIEGEITLMKKHPDPYLPFSVGFYDIFGSDDSVGLSQEEIEKSREELRKKIQRYEELFEKGEYNTIIEEISGLGFCHRYWSAKKYILEKEYNIHWKTPQELNPHVRFD